MSVDPESGATLPDGATSPFPNPCETPIDINAQAQSRVLTQYREATKLKGFIADIAQMFQDIEDCDSLISVQRDPAIAGGANLDDVGELVGQDRVLINGTELSDSEYRTWIAQRILRNKSIGSGPEFVAALEAVLSPTAFRFVDLGHMAVIIELATGAPPTDDQIALLDKGPIPRAMAVGVGRRWYDPASYFGFIEDPSALGFAEIGDPPPPGGHLADTF